MQCNKKKEKTQGNDNITNDVLIALYTFLKPVLAIFNGILRTGTSPEQWLKSKIVVLNKEGDRSDLGNYKPLSIMTNLNKIFSKIILTKIIYSMTS